ncbi:MAG TPA: hypothetical protein VF576_05860 [Rubricoccaceae bacterium]|jgi:hypothetical protein
MATTVLPTSGTSAYGPWTATDDTSDLYQPTVDGYLTEVAFSADQPPLTAGDDDTFYVLEGRQAIRREDRAETLWARTLGNEHAGLVFKITHG